MAEDERNMGIQVVPGRWLVVVGQRDNKIEEGEFIAKSLGIDFDPLVYVAEQISIAPERIRLTCQGAQEIVAADLEGKGKTIDQAVLTRFKTETQKRIETAQLE